MVHQRIQRVVLNELQSRFSQIGQSTSIACLATFPTHQLLGLAAHRLQDDLNVQVCSGPL
jgi:hypothetical protein